MPDIQRLFTVLIGCYGDYPRLSTRAITSVTTLCRVRDRFNVLVGLNSCCRETIDYARNAADEGRVDAIVESRDNINKDPLMRTLLELVRTPYVLWMDDDSHVLAAWDLAIVRFLDEHHMKFECAGHVFYSQRSREYIQFLRQRPWWLSDEDYLEKGHKQRVWFPTGGYWLARVSFLRKNDYPDRGMVKKQDDLLLGDLLSQQKGRLINFNRDIMNTVRISDAGPHGRRGKGEGTDGWLDVNLITGFKK